MGAWIERGNALGGRISQLVICMGKINFFNGEYS